MHVTKSLTKCWPTRSPLYRVPTAIHTKLLTNCTANPLKP